MLQELNTIYHYILLYIALRSHYTMARHLVHRHNLLCLGRSERGYNIQVPDLEDQLELELVGQLPQELEQEQV